MLIEMLLKYILCCAMLLLVSPTTFANEVFYPRIHQRKINQMKDSPFPPTIFVDSENGCAGYQSNYTFTRTCNYSSKYRTMDGSCNNKNDPIRGKSFTPFKRFQESDYEDGVHMPVTGRPDPRDLSRFLFSDNTDESLEERANANFVTFGQYLIHDLAFFALNHKDVQCCPTPTNLTECMSDTFLDYAECLDCHKFIRSLGVGGRSGETASREQLNIISHYIDGSLIYGSSQEELDSLRDAQTGKMKITDIGNNHLLPTAAHIMGSNSCPLFRAGDTRLNENFALALHHTFWLREHNTIVDKLLSLNKTWDKEILFQEARRIVVAELEHITYEEFLPLLIGKTLVEEYQLHFNSSQVYQPYVDASVANAFTTAAFRYGHLMLDDLIFLDQNDTDQSRANTSGICNRDIDSFPCYSTHTVTLEESLRSADRIYSCKNSVDSVIKGSINRAAHLSNDMRFAKTLRTKLVNTDDLISVNIQRGRDHGLPPYQVWRNWCELDPISFDYPSNSHTSCALRKLKLMYKTEDSIDLYVGGALEIKRDDAVLGPTFACLVAHQFYDSKFGDRFWYENNQFTKDQLMEISRQTISKLIKRNTNISLIPPNAFMIPSESNVPQNIDADFNIAAWN